MVNRLFARGIQRPLQCVLILGILCLASVPGLQGLRMDSSADGLFKRGDPLVSFFEETRELFGESVVLSVVIEADDIFRGEILEQIRNLTVALEEIDGVTQVASLANLTNLKGRGGTLFAGEALAAVPKDAAGMAQLREDILGNRLLVAEVINAEGTAAALHLFLESRPEERMYERRVLTGVEEKLVHARAGLSGDVRLYTCGFPFVKVKVLEYIRSDAFRLTPLACLAMFLILWIHFRSWVAALLPNVTGMISVLLTLGFMGYAGIPVNPLTTIVPILVLVIGSTEDVHMTCAYSEALRRGLGKTKALLRIGPECGLAVLLTAGTTMAGFAALIPSRIPMVSEFGIACCFGMAANFLVTVLVVPVYLKMIPVPPAFLENRGARFTRLGAWLTRAIEDRSGPLAAVFLVASMAAALGISRVEVDTDYLAFFRENSEIVQVHEEVSRNLVGTQVFQVVLECRGEGDLRDPEVLEEVARVSDDIQSRTDKVLGFPDLIRKLNREFAGGDDAAWKIPESRALISQYSLLLAEEDLERFVDPDFRRTCLLVRSSVQGSAPLNQLVRRIEDTPERLGCRAVFARVTGESVLIAQTSDAMSRQLILSLSLVFGFIFVCLAVICRSIRAGLLGIVPNVFSIVMLFGLMGWQEIALSTATYPVAIIALGIAVDDTIHFLVRFFENRKRGSSRADAVKETIDRELLPIVSTSIALVGGFLVASMAELACIHRFGLLGAYVMIMALIGDLGLTPLLLRRASS